MVRLYQLLTLVHREVHFRDCAARQVMQEGDLFAAERDTEIYLMRTDIFG